MSPGIAARKQEQKPQSRTLFILFTSHGLFVSNRSGSLNRSLFHCYRSQRELELRVGRVYPSLSRLLVSWTKIQGAPASTRGRCASLPWFTDPHISPPSPPLPHPLSHSLLPLPRSLLVGGSGGAHPLCTILRMHACMHACTSLAARAVQLLRGYNLIYIVRQSPPGQTGHSSYCHN